MTRTTAFSTKVKSTIGSADGSFTKINGITIIMLAMVVTITVVLVTIAAMMIGGGHMRPPVPIIAAMTGATAPTQYVDTNGNNVVEYPRPTVHIDVD